MWLCVQHLQLHECQTCPWQCLEPAGPPCTPLTTGAPCSIPKNMHLAKLIKGASLFVWDETPCHKSSSSSLSAGDIMTDVDAALESVHFGGIPVVFGGDFRQVLPVSKHSGRAAIVERPCSRCLPSCGPQSSSSS